MKLKYIILVVAAGVLFLDSCTGSTSSSGSTSSASSDGDKTTSTSSSYSTSTGDDDSSDAPPNSNSDEDDSTSKPSCTGPGDESDDCKTNEEFTNCTQIVCRAQECSQRDKPVACPGIVEGSCTSGCVCKSGTLRDDYGDCVPEKECPEPEDCPDNEEFSDCTQALCRAQECSQKGKPIACPAIAEGYCKSGCVCQSGKLRNSTGTCVSEDQCQPVCGQNEELSDCTQIVCRAQECSHKGRPVACPSIRKSSCISGCVCLPGTLRNNNGDCVPETDCQQIGECPVNEKYSYCIQAEGPQNCSQIGQIDFDYSDYCDSGCVCVNGTLRAENGTCVPESDCELECNENENVVKCPAKCVNDYCPVSEFEEDYCSSTETDDECGPPRCECRFNYLRAENGTCISTRDCPPFYCGGENEEFNACPPICPTDSCSQATPTGRCPLPGRIGIVLQCRPKCRCIPGYWRNDDGVCVPYGQCPGICPANEEYTTCVQSLGRIQNCSQIAEQPSTCPSPYILLDDICRQGCVCAEGFVRSDNGTCITVEQCEEELCPENEEFSKCKQIVCRPENCSQVGQPLNCTPITEGCCETGCVCQDGFVRADNGTCISEYQCDELILNGYCGENEEFSNCTQTIFRPQTCFDVGEPMYVVDDGQCQIGCVCVEGTVRNGTGTCIPQNLCEVCSGPNEVFTRCKKACQPDTCSSLVSRPYSEFECVELAICNPGCVCADGYWRDEETGTCSTLCECPEMADAPACNVEYNIFN